VTLSAFGDAAHAPAEGELRATLGSSYAAWSRLREEVATRVPDLRELWAFSGKSTGWGLRLRHRERVLVYMTPRDGAFLVSLALGEKAVAKAHDARLPKQLLSAIDAAPRYAEGRGLRVQVARVGQVSALAKLAQIKHET
jgi:hypothetical protein